MGLEVKLGERVARVKLISRQGDKLIVDIDGKHYSVDLVRVENGCYSILHKGKSYNVEVIPGDGPKNFFVNTYSAANRVEIIDAQSRYQRSRKVAEDQSADRIISTPMPGRVVRIPVSEGDSVTKGTTVIVISAMKMESEYKSPIDGVVKKIHVAPDDTINANQPLVEIE